MAKFTKSEDISVHQSLRYTDGVPGTPPNKVISGRLSDLLLISGSEEIYQQFGTGSNLLQVFRPYQGFDLLYKNPNRNEGSTEITQDLDKRFKLGTYTLNDRGSWEDNNFNESNLGPYLTEEFEGKKSYKLKTRRTIIVDTADGPITLLPAQGQDAGYATPIGPHGEHNSGIYSIETLPFVINPNDDEIIRVDRYYDKEIHKEQYELATEGKINLKIVLSYAGRFPTKNDNIEYLYVSDYKDPDNPDTTSWRADRSDYMFSGSIPSFGNAEARAYFDYTLPVEPDYLPTDNFGQNIDIFSDRPPRSNGGYADALIVNGDNAESENDGAYVFKLNWGDGTVLEHTDDPLLLESTTLLEHFYDKPGFYSITGVVYRAYRGHIMNWERFQTNILLNASPLYETKLFDFNNFASIGGLSKNSAFVKSLYNLIGVNPLPPFNTDRINVDNLSKFNLLDIISTLNTLGKVDYELIQESFSNLLSPYQTPNDDEDSFVFGCTNELASNWNPDANVDDGSCILIQDVTLVIAGEPPIPISFKIDDSDYEAVEIETEPEFPPAGISPENPMIGALSPLQQYQWSGTQWTFIGPEGDDLGSLTVRIGTRELKMLTPQGFEAETVPTTPPAGAGAMNPMFGTLSPLEQWVWDGTAWQENPDFTAPTDGSDTLGFYDYVFDGWFDEDNNPIPTDDNGVAQVLIVEDRTFTAKFRYEDTTDPEPVALLDILNQELLDSLSFDSIGIYFNHPAASEDDFDYDDIHYFIIDRFYYDYIEGSQVQENEITRVYITERMTEQNLHNLGQGVTYEYEYIDENLPYREYSYRIKSVDSSGRMSAFTNTPIALYPTPDDTTPQAIPNGSLSLIQYRPKRLLFSWQQISEAWPGLEGNFKHFKIEVDGPNADDYVYQYVGEYTGDESQGLIPTSFEEYYPNGLVQRQFNDVGGSDGQFYTPSGDAMTLEWTTVLPWRFKISVVGDTSENDESPATQYIEVVPENYIGADINVIGQANTFQQMGAPDSIGQITETNSTLKISFNIQNFLTEYAENAFAGNPLQLDGVDPNHPNGFLAEDKNGLYIRIFTKDLINGDQNIPGYNPTYIGEPFDISYNNTVREYLDFEVEIGSQSNLEHLINRRLYVGLFDSNDNNLVAETSDFVQINQIYGCMDPNADNQMENANVNYNCSYSYKINTVSYHESYQNNLNGALIAYRCEFQQNESDGGYLDDVGTWRPGPLQYQSIILTGIEGPDSQPTINYNDVFETVGNQYFILFEIRSQGYSEYPNQTTFKEWIIENPSGLQFAEVTNEGSLGDNATINLGNWTDDITSLNEVTQENQLNNSDNGAAYIAVKATEFAGPNNYSNKAITVKWFDNSGATQGSGAVTHVDIILYNGSILGGATRVRFMETGFEFVSSVDEYLGSDPAQKVNVGVNQLFSIEGLSGADENDTFGEWIGWYFDFVIPEDELDPPSGNLLLSTDNQLTSLIPSEYSDYWVDGDNGRPVLKLYAKATSGMEV